MLTHKELKKRALECADVKDEYRSLDEQFALLDESLKARVTSSRTTGYPIRTAPGHKRPPTRGASQR